MEGIKLIPYIVLVLAITGVIVGASVISLVQFGDTVERCWNASYAYNESFGGCYNATPGVSGSVGIDDLNLSDEYYGITQSVQGQNVIAEQLPTVAIIAVMVIIISIIAGVFVYMRYFR